MKLFLTSLLIIFGCRALANEIPTLRFPLGVSLEVFDPTEAEDFVTIRVLMNLGSGLMRSDKNLKPLPELADSYKISKNKQTYTFKLKKAYWSDGTLITADHFIHAFKRTLSPQTKAKISQTFQEIIEGAKDYKTSKISDFNKVGIKALDQQSIEFKLIHPSPYFLSLLTLPFTFPLREGMESIKVNTPTTGRYIMSDFKSASKIILSPNTKHHSPAKNNVELRFIMESSTLVALYDKNEIDVLEKVPSSDFDRFKNSPQLVSAPFLATYYLGFNVTKKPFDDVKMRKLIISNIKRDEINKVMRDPQKISSSWVPTPLGGSQKDYVIKQQTPDMKGSTFDFTLAFDAQEKNTLIATLIQNQLKKSIGYTVPLKSMEWKSFLKYLTSEKPAFFRFAWLAAFPDPLSHLNVFKSNNPNNYTGYSSKEYDTLVDSIARTPSGALREKLIAQAQKKLLLDDAVVMPLFHYVQYFLMRKEWTGLEVTPMGLLYFDQATRVSLP